MMLWSSILNHLSRKYTAIWFSAAHFAQVEFDVYHQHNLRFADLRDFVSSLNPEGMAFFFRQRKKHPPSIEDCVLCLDTWFQAWRVNRADSARPRWAGASESWLQQIQSWVVQGVERWKTPQGKEILESAGTRFLGYDQFHEITYLAMYAQGLRCGIQGKDADNFAFLRASLLADFSVLSDLGPTTVSGWVDQGFGIVEG